MNVFLTYCAVCWTLAPLLHLWLVSDPEAEEWEKLEEEELRAVLSARARWQNQILVAILGPLWVPIAVAAVLICYCRSVLMLRMLRNSRRTFHEYCFTEINYYEQSAEARAAFDEATRETMPFDFRLVGDYRLKTEPVTVLDRFFWGSDDTTWCACCWIAELSEPGDRNVEIGTLLSDGTHVGTAMVDEPHPDTPATAAEDRLHISHVPELSLEEALSRHVCEVHRVATERGLEILQFDKEQLEALVIYNQRLYHHWLHRTGRTVEPPAPELPPAKTRLTPDEYLLTVAGGEFSSARNGHSEELAY